MSEYVLLATLGKPQGLRGEMRAFVYTESALLPKGPVLVCKEHEELEKAKTLVLKKSRPHTSGKGGNAVCLFEEISDRTEAEAWHRASVYVKADDLPDLNEDELYVHDMIGLSVVLHEDDAPVGTLEQVTWHGEQELWLIVTADGKEVFLPAVPEFVNDIDLTQEIIRISPPEGLLDLYLSDSEKDEK